MIEQNQLIANISSDNTLIGDIGKTIEIIRPTLIEKNITANGEYNASTDEVDGYSKVNVNVPEPTGTIDIITNAIHNVKEYEFANVNVPLGLEYESGTYTPTEDTQRPTINFSRTHTNTPVFVMIMGSSSERPATGGLGFWYYIDYEKTLGATIPYSASTNYYELVYLYYIRTGTTYTGTNAQLRYPSSETTDTSPNYPRYFVTPSNFKPGVSGTSQATFVANTQYKWIAIWK